MSIRRYLVALFITTPALAQTPMTLRETSMPGRIFSIQSRVEISGSLTVPAEKGKLTTVGVSGRSSIAYDEKPLTAMPDGATRTLRQYRQAEFRRTMNDRAQETTIRPFIRRMVVLRSGTREVPFSPDGPLTFGEIDLVRTDVFAPALLGLLPTKSLQLNDTWQAANSAVEELTDFERIEQGGLECRLVSADNRVAKVAFAGTITGVNEDGPVRQQLDGHFTFDREGSFIASLELTGVKSLLDRDGKTTGKIEGKFKLTREIAGNVIELSDEQIRGLTLEPNPINTLLLYEGAVANVRFTYPRRWRVSVEQGRQITLDGPSGNGLLLTVEPPDKVPSPTDFARETQDYIVKQKGRVIRADPPLKLRPFPLEIERFGMDIELSNQPARMEYAVIRQQTGGATVAARLAPTDAAALRPEFDQFIKSVQIGNAAPAGVVPLPGK